jgi:hypothetical protein
MESQLYYFFNLGARRTVLSQRHASAALPKGKDTLYPFYRRLDGHQGRSGGVRKISPPPGLDLRIVHPVESRYAASAQRPIQLCVKRFMYWT